MSGKTRTERIRERSKARREREKEETHDAILKAAGELFIENGYSKFSLRQVAERAGYAPSTIYLYFDDKDDLLFTLADQGFKKFIKSFEQVLEVDESPADKLHHLGRSYLDFALSNPVHYQMMFIQRPDFLLESADPEEEDTIRLQSFGVLQYVVAQTMEAGVLPAGDVNVISNMLWGLVHGLAALAIRMGDMFKAHEAYDALDAAMDMMLHRPEE